MTAVPPRPAAPDRGAWVCERCGNAPEQHAAGRVAQACIYAPGFDGSLRPAAPCAMAGGELTELVASDVHQAWVEAKLSQGITSRPSADGIEQMVPYSDLPDHLQELDRATVRAVLDSPALRDVLAAAARDAELREAVTSLAVRFETLSESLFSAASINAYDAAAKCLRRALDGTT